MLWYLLELISWSMLYVICKSVRMFTVMFAGQASSANRTALASGFVEDAWSSTAYLAVVFVSGLYHAAPIEVLWFRSSFFFREPSV